MKTATWLHLSDLHFRVSERNRWDENIVLRAMLVDLRERMASDGWRPDLILVSGDIAFSGKPEEYALAGQFFDELLGVSGLTQERLFVVPGNHDVDRSAITRGAAAIAASLNDRQAIAEVLTADDDRRLLLRRFNPYADFVNSYLAGHLTFDDRHYFYAQHIELEAGRIAVLGLNSAWLSASDQDLGRLALGERQVRQALESVNQADLRIALLHHPLEWCQEFDRNDCEPLLMQACDLILHGHLHRAGLVSLTTPDAGAMVIAAGACYETRQYPNGYNLVQFDVGVGQGTVYLRRYSDERGGFWTRDVMTYKNVEEGVYRFRLPGRGAAQVEGKHGATVTGSGAIAQGTGTKAAGERGVVADTIYGPVVTGNQNRVVQAENYVERQEVHTPPPPDLVERARTHYLKRLRQQCNVLPLGALGGEQDMGQDVSLEQVYVALDTQTRVPLASEEKTKREAVQPGREEEKLLPALDAATQNPHLVLLGDPGSGKSTFVRQLTAWLAAACLGERDPLPGWDTCLLPMLTTLRELAPRLGALKLDGLTDKEQQRQLVEAVQEQWHADLGELGAHDLAPGLEEALADGKVVLVLDGLDEVPTGLRGRVRQAVRAILQAYPAVQRVIVTCRVRSYAGAAVLREFADHTLAPFDRDKIGQFVRAWYDAQAGLDRIKSQQAKSRAQDLEQAALSNDLIPLASNPMLLTTMAIIHQREVGLPRERVRLYAQAVQVLISRWQKRKGISVSGTLEQVLSRDLELRSILERLGYEAHRIQSAQGSEADLARRDILALLEAPEYLGEAGLASEFLDYCDQRTGLLIGRGGEEGHKPQTYTFPHRTFQEYLAGCYMVKGRAREIAAEYLARVREGDYWYLAARLGAEELLYNKTKPEDVLDLAYALCPARAPAQELDWRAVLWSGQTAALLGREQVTRDADKPLGDKAYLDRLLPRLVETLREERLGAVERAEAGRALGKLGDPRPEVMMLDHMEFCLVPRGPFWMGSGEEPGAYPDEKPQRQVNLPDYLMARYPMTQAQFAAFVDAGGYKEQRFWGEAQAANVWREGYVHLEWAKEIRDKPAAFGEPFDLPNHPVVGVTWYEALAFTYWLTEQWRERGLLPEGWQVRLPSEAEWEKAARGGKQISNLSRPEERSALSQISNLKKVVGEKVKLVENPKPKRRYPWGDEPDANRMNYYDTRIETTSAVGCFPGGVSPYGCEEMSGNVWEWTQSINKDYPYDPKDGRESLEAGTDIARVLRGGAFGYSENLVRCAFRLRLSPDLRDRRVGFRVVLSPL